MIGTPNKQVWITICDTTNKPPVDNRPVEGVKRRVLYFEVPASVLGKETNAITLDGVREAVQYWLNNTFSHDIT